MDLRAELAHLTAATRVTACAVDHPWALNLTGRTGCALCDYPRCPTCRTYAATRDQQTCTFCGRPLGLDQGEAA